MGAADAGRKMIAGILVALGLISGTGGAMAQSTVTGSLTQGQWAEGRDFDPFGSRPVQLWLPEGTLIFDIQPSDRVRGASARKYRAARTYHGYPVNLRLFPRPGTALFKRLASLDGPPRFRLNTPVYCPAETSPILPSGGACNHGRATGEGWVFDLSSTTTNTPLGPRLTATAQPDAATVAQLGSAGSALFSFEIYQRDLDLYERQGILFRMDRSHPLSSFDFVGHDYFPCNTSRTVEFKEEAVTKAFAKAEASSEFGFWSWFKGKVSAGAGYEDKGSTVRAEKTVVDSSSSSAFQQWGLMRQDAIDSQTPFFVEKRFECNKGTGTTKPGERITSVEISFWNDEEDRNDVYEFNDPNDFVTMEDAIFDRHQRPIFFSINDSGKQAAVIAAIMARFPRLSHHQAVFIFAQLNNGCGGTHRQACDALVTVAGPGS